MSGDKKATALSFHNTRGKRVVAEARIAADICRNVLKAEPRDIYEAWKISIVSSVQSGTIGSQSHYANGLTALFIATGQDAACISEASVGITEYSVEDDGSLVCNVTLPNLVVGTVGGGTGLPTQKECLESLGCHGTGKASKFAEICAGLVVAGEISITAAIAAGHFAQAHQVLARGPGAGGHESRTKAADGMSAGGTPA
jgi:hydroxymethylglutaryl-CoA reductase (NADPH)